MSARRDSARSVRVARSWARLGLVTGAASGLLVVAAVVLLDRGEEATPPRVHVGSPIDRPVAEAGEAGPTATSPVSSHTRVVLSPVVRATPKSVRDVLRQDVALTTNELAAWISDDAVDAQARYGALRRLEQEDPAAAVTAALALLDDVRPLLRLNAIAVLTRANDARATAALEKLDDRSRQLALALVRR